MDDLTRRIQQQNTLNYQRTQKQKKEASPPPLLRIGEYHPETGRYKVIYPNSGEVIAGLKLFNSSVSVGTPVKSTRAYGAQSIGLDYRNYQPILAEEEKAIISIPETIKNNPPIANSDSITTNQNTSVTISVLNNDTDIDGTLDLTSIEIVSPPSNGATTVSLLGQITYTPNPGFTGADSFIYFIWDNLGALSNPATVNITVNPVLPPPTTCVLIYSFESNFANPKTVDLPCSSIIQTGEIENQEPGIENVYPEIQNFDSNGYEISFYYPDFDEYTVITNIGGGFVYRSKLLCHGYYITALNQGPVGGGNWQLLYTVLPQGDVDSYFVYGNPEILDYYGILYCLLCTHPDDPELVSLDGTLYAFIYNGPGFMDVIENREITCPHSKTYFIKAFDLEGNLLFEDTGENPVAYQFPA